MLTLLISSCTSIQLGQVKNDSCLLFFKSEYNQKEWSCTASLLTQDTLITAAHCADAFSDTNYSLDRKNKIYGYCDVNNRLVDLKVDSFSAHPKYQFNNPSTNHFDIGLVRLENPLKVSIMNSLALNSALIEPILNHNECYISGFPDSLDKDEKSITFETSPHFIFLKSINLKGIQFQSEFKNNLAVIHGGLAERKKYNQIKESLKQNYPGPGYSGSPLICRYNDKSFFIGVYVGGFENTNSWVSILFINEVGEWIQSKSNL